MKLQILVAVFLVVSVYGRPRNDVVKIPRWNMGSITCDVCEVVVRDIRAAILGREEEVIQSVVERCEAIFFFRMLDCSAVASLLTPLLDKLTLTPEQICRGLSFCRGLKHTAPEYIVSGLDGVEGMSLMSQGSTQGGHTKVYNSHELEQDFQCQLCESIVTIFYDTVTHQATWKDIARLINPLCKYYPQKDRCHGYIDRLPDEAFSFAMEFLNKEVDCKFLGYCSAEKKSTIQTTGTTSSTVQCEVCEGIVMVLHDTVACSDTWTDLATMLLPKCAACPVPEQCKAFLNGLPAMMKTVADKYLNKETDCSQYCTNPPPEQVFLGTAATTPQCDLCQGVVTVLHDGIACSNTWTDLANILLPKCVDCPVPEQCKAFLNGLPAMMKKLADKYLNKETDCTKFCTNPPPDRGFLGTASSTAQCDVCEGIVMVLHDTAACSDTWTDLATMLLPKCAACPVPEQCKAFLNGLPAMMKTVADKYLNKETDCTKFCTNPPPDQVFLGTASSTVQCEVCEGIVMVLHDTAACSDTWTDLATMLLPKCAACPVPEQCKAFLNGLPAMMKTVADKYLNKETDCTKFCTNPPPDQVFLGTASSTVQCEVCEGIVMVLHDTAACSDTWLQDHLATMLLPKCAACPVPEQCKAFLNGLPAMMKTVADKYMNKETDCSQYCTNPPPEQVLLGTAATTTQCDLCQGVVTVLHDVIACSNTWTDLANMLLPKCADCPVPEQCKAFLNGLPAMMKKLADKYLNKETDCTKFCTNLPPDQFLDILSSDDDSRCGLCKTFIALLYDLLTNTATWTDISNLLIPTCKHSPAPEECTAMLHALPASLHIIADNYLNQDADCSRFGFCTSNSTKPFLGTGSSGTLKCDLCKGFITALYDAIACTDTWTDIANMLLPKCEDCPVPEQCKEFLNGLPAMMKTLADTLLNSETDCAKLCTNTPKQVFFPTVSSGTVQCDLCQGIVTVLHDVTACSDSWTDVANMLLPKCENCPVPEQCKAFLKGLPAIMKTLADKYLNKETECAKYCTHPPPEQVFLHLQSSKDVSNCELCKEVVSLVYSVCKSTAIWEQISNLLMPNCKQCPEPDKCRAFLKTLPATMQTIADGYLNADNDCTVFHLCTTDNSAAVSLGKNNSETEKKSSQPDENQCTICKVIASTGHHMVTENEQLITDKLTEYLTKWCKTLTSRAMRTQCASDIAVILPPLMVNFLKDTLNVNTLCVDLLHAC